MLIDSNEDIIRNHCNTAIEYAKTLNKHLDFSEASLADVEEILDQYYEDLSSKNPTQDEIESLAMIWGIYLARPIYKVYKRLMNGPEDNVISFYNVIKYKVIEKNRGS